MPSLEYPFILGTAGHIDHGKTALVKALSGVDCDRLAEEKKRGMTIELGFAPLALPSGKTISIIDVPGHEKFIRQMVAGAAGIDAVMLVVAADDGVMPQTREHLEILTLLGIKHGITVINKIDLVDEDMLEMAKDDVISLIGGTFLEGAPIIPASALTGVGLPEVGAAISELVESGGQRSRSGAFFLPVDRAFHITGFGTVVTGTATRGFVSEGDDLEVLPSGVVAKVRSIQVHSEPVKTAIAGQRVAVNLSGVSLDDVKRGDAIAAKGRYGATSCIDATVRVLASFAEPIEHWQRLRLHVGTADVVARISLLDREKIAPGESAPAQLITEEPIPATRDSRFILRTYSPLRTVAGGRVILSRGERPKNKSTRAALVQLLDSVSGGADLKETILALVDYKGLISSEDARVAVEAETREFESAASSLEMKGRVGVVRSGDATFISMQKAEALRNTLTSALENFHKAHPERMGMDAEEAARSLGMTDTRFVRELIKLFKKYGWIGTDDDRVRLKDFEPFDESRFMAQVSALKDIVKRAGYSMPTIEEAAAALGFAPKDMDRVLSYLKERRDATIIGGGFILLTEIENDFRSKLSALAGDITLAGVRDLTGSSRKYALPLLEYLDSKGVTRRVGDKRILLKKHSN